jgi:hypothetical protein
MEEGCAKLLYPAVLPALYGADAGGQHGVILSLEGLRRMRLPTLASYEMGHPEFVDGGRVQMALPWSHCAAARRQWGTQS